MSTNNSIVKGVSAPNAGLDIHDNLLIKGTKIILNHLGVEIALEVVAGVLYINGVAVSGGSGAFNPAGTTLVSTTLQTAIVELSAKVDAINAILS